MASETDQIMARIPIDRFAARLGTDEATAREAAEAALPTLLAGLANEAQDPPRARALAEAVRRDHDAATLAADDPLDRVDEAEGDRIVAHVFGPDRGRVEGQVQQFLGDGAGSLVRRAMPLLAPLVMSWLAGKMGGGRTATPPGRADAGGSGGFGDLLGDLLGGIAGGEGARRPQPRGGGLADILGDLAGAGGAGATAGRGGPAGGGGLADVLGQLGGRAGGGGGLDDLLGSILGPGSPAPRSERRAGGVTDVGDVFG